MNSRSSSKMSRLVACGSRIARRLIACAALIIPLTINAATAAPEEEVRATFDRFVAAQNAHDIKAVESLLLSTSDFLWITRGTAVWGLMRRSNVLRRCTTERGVSTPSPRA